ncbi:hypothetical protein CONLIGDRAFT_678122 [Coniochaeta ligniaria NRRL 30616]|uniref:Uncharacterized protein n=1 Tax=Coniochaeta ligniaria NRRL 30616 TaxID=1408157 RepID=A0A1J7JP26_9PEZI|nr:hypothetical protein CONLIGDRAFT_678122 [Coniochaeta ligniaria NRRL 30616]
MPVLTRNDISSVPNTPEGSTESSPRIWVTVLVVVGSILLVAAFVAAVLVFFRRRGYREAKKHNPALSRKEFLRRRKMTAVARQTDEELQRRMMIRKSLAGRSNEWSTQFDNESLDIHEHSEHGLKEDWKEWEARMQRERPELACRHPSIAALPELPIPTKSSSSSPSRSPLLSGQSPPLFGELPRL